MLFAIQGGVSGFVGSRSGACRKPQDGTKYFRRDTVLGNRHISGLPVSTSKTHLSITYQQVRCMTRAVLIPSETVVDLSYGQV